MDQLYFLELIPDQSMYYCKPQKLLSNKCTKYIIYFFIYLYCIYSDITVSFADQKVKAHKFVLAARGDHWSNRDLNEISELELTGDLISSVFNIIYNIMHFQ